MGSNFMVAIVLIHMVQSSSSSENFRESSLIGRRLSLADDVRHGLTGQVLRFDQTRTGLGFGASIASRVPIAGPIIVKLMLVGRYCRSDAVAIFALHVFVISEC